MGIRSPSDGHSTFAADCAGAKKTGKSDHSDLLFRGRGPNALQVRDLIGGVQLADLDGINVRETESAEPISRHTNGYSLIGDKLPSSYLSAQ